MPATAEDDARPPARQVIPNGALCFFASYGQMDAAAKCWKESGAWDALEQLKHIVTEKRGACALDSPRARLSLRAQLH